LLIRRLLDAEAVETEQLMACDVDEQRLQELADRFGIATSLDNTCGAAFADAVIVAVPPPEVVPVLKEMADNLNETALVVSLAPGVSIEQMQEVLPRHAQLARVMPNTPSQVGAGMNPHAVADDIMPASRELLLKLLDVWGDTVEIEESQMNAACALLAVGPTYLFPIAAELIEDATAADFPEQEASAAVAKLFTGVGAMIERTGMGPDDLLAMISMQPMDAESVRELLGEAFDTVIGKLEGLESKLSG
jgi:pyrroline-5-carboxylate reductase